MDEEDPKQSEASYKRPTKKREEQSVSNFDSDEGDDPDQHGKVY